MTTTSLTNEVTMIATNGASESAVSTAISTMGSRKSSCLHEYIAAKDPQARADLHEPPGRKANAVSTNDYLSLKVGIELKDVARLQAPDQPDCDAKLTDLESQLDRQLVQLGRCDGMPLFSCGGRIRLRGRHSSSLRDRTDPPIRSPATNSDV